MEVIEWSNVGCGELKDGDYLVKCYRKFLRKECEYTTEEAKWCADVIDNPYSKIVQDRITKEHITTTLVSGTLYEIFFCSVLGDSSSAIFQFYMLVDVESQKKNNTGEYSDSKWWSYYISKKKFCFIQVNKIEGEQEGVRDE